MSKHALILIGLTLVGCGPQPTGDDAGIELGDAGSTLDAGSMRPDDPWADRVSRFVPGAGAGFGQDRFPEIVLGPPSGGGEVQGSLDVLSLGKNGVIELELTDIIIIDGPGIDFLVFENGFTGFLETGAISVSEDGTQWHDFPCAALTDKHQTAGCAGLQPVFANPAQGISGTDPTLAGGDGFDLAQLGLSKARFIRVRDSGTNQFYGPPAGGFDLDAVAVVNGQKSTP